MSRHSVRISAFLAKQGDLGTVDYFLKKVWYPIVAPHVQNTALTLDFKVPRYCS